MKRISDQGKFNEELSSLIDGMIQSGVSKDIISRFANQESSSFTRSGGYTPSKLRKSHSSYSDLSLNKQRLFNEGRKNGVPIHRIEQLQKSAESIHQSRGFVPQAFYDSALKGNIASFGGQGSFPQGQSNEPQVGINSNPPSVSPLNMPTTDSLFNQQQSPVGIPPVPNLNQGLNNSIFPTAQVQPQVQQKAPVSIFNASKANVNTSPVVQANPMLGPPNPTGDQKNQMTLDTLNQNTHNGSMFGSTASEWLYGNYDKNGKQVGGHMQDLNALGGVAKGGFDLWNQYKARGMAEDKFNWQKDNYKRDFNNQAFLTNRHINDVEMGRGQLRGTDRGTIVAQQNTDLWKKKNNIQRMA